jgi:hypothetical protein
MSIGMKETLIRGWASTRVALIALICIFALSLVLFLTAGSGKKRVVLFYPKDDLFSVSGDFHIIPVREDRGDSMKILLSEALLQPFDYHLNNTVPEGVVVNSFIYDKDNNAVYADFSLEMISPEDDNPTRVDSGRMLEILEKNIRFNYRNVQDVEFTVDGQVPYSHVFSGGNG